MSTRKSTTRTSTRKKPQKEDLQEIELSEEEIKEYHKAIYKMDLHSLKAITDKGHYVIRVPGGWLYYQNAKAANGDQLTTNAVFVPYSDEFNNT